MPRTAGTLPATHGGDTAALLTSTSPPEPGAPKAGQGLCLLCRDGGLLPIQHCTDMGHYQDTELSPVPHCRDTGPCLPCAADTGGTASLALPDTKAPPTRHFRDAGAPCIIHSALHAGHWHPRAPLAERAGHRLTAHPALLCRQTPWADSVCPQGAVALHSPSTLQWQAQHLPSAAQSLGNPTPCASKYCSLHSLQTHSSFLFPPTPDWNTACTHWGPTLPHRDSPALSQCPSHPLQRQ